MGTIVNSEDERTWVNSCNRELANSAESLANLHAYPIDADGIHHAVYCVYMLISLYVRIVYVFLLMYEGSI